MFKHMWKAASCFPGEVLKVLWHIVNDSREVSTGAFYTLYVWLDETRLPFLFLLVLLSLSSLTTPSLCCKSIPGISFDGLHSLSMLLPKSCQNLCIFEDFWKVHVQIGVHCSFRVSSRVNSFAHHAWPSEVFLIKPGVLSRKQDLWVSLITFMKT